MPASAARIAANRSNAQRSTGPRTPEGKARSRGNALKHGLTGEGVVVHEEDAAELALRVAAWLDDLKPQGEAERAVAARIAVASARLDRCTRREAAAVAQRVQDAAKRFRRNSKRRADSAGRKLLQGAVDRLPVLRATADGNRWLLAQWERLARRLEESGELDLDALWEAVHLMGRHRRPVKSDCGLTPGLWRAGLGSHATPPAELVERHFGLDAGAGLGEPGRLARARERLGPREECREALRRFFAARIAYLRPEVDRLEAEEAPARALSLDLALFDGGPESARMLRYESAHEAAVHRGLRLLERARKERAAAQNEPNDERDPFDPPGLASRAPRDHAAPRARRGRAVTADVLDRGRDGTPTGDPGNGPGDGAQNEPNDEPDVIAGQGFETGTRRDHAAPPPRDRGDHAGAASSDELGHGGNGSPGDDRAVGKGAAAQNEPNAGPDLAEGDGVTPRGPEDQGGAATRPGGDVARAIGLAVALVVAVALIPASARPPGGPDDLRVAAGRAGQARGGPAGSPARRSATSSRTPGAGGTVDRALAPRSWRVFGPRRETNPMFGRSPKSGEDLGRRGLGTTSRTDAALRGPSRRRTGREAPAEVSRETKPNL